MDTPCWGPLMKTHDGESWWRPLVSRSSPALVFLPELVGCSEVVALFALLFWSGAAW